MAAFAERIGIANCRIIKSESLGGVGVRTCTS